MSQKFYTALLFLAFLATGAMAQNPTKTITDDDLQGGTSYTWSSDTTYLLDGFVFLETGAILTIEPGTVIKGLQSPSNDDLASTLVITRGAQIFAEGTRNNPIIFTAEIDDTEDPNDMFVDDRGLWGGLILLGNATITNETDEVIVEGLPADDDRSLYGGSDDADNSGVLKYISIRHGGAELAPGEEINGLTLGAIGSGTSLSFVEVLANVDDGIEFFGGTVDMKYATVAFCGDDAIDWDTGWRGRGQFWSVLQGADAADNGAEMDGAKPDANTPSSNPQVYNVTYVGSGQGAAAANEHALYFRDGTRGGYYNSIFTDYANYAIQVEDRASGVDSRQYMEQGELVIANNLWFGFGEGNELNAGDNGFIQATDDAEDPTAQFLIDHLAANSNAVVDPQLGGISRDADGGYDPRPAADGPAYTTAPAPFPTDDFYTKVEFKGAYCAEGSWLTGWTALAEYGVMADGVDYTDFTDEFACDLLQATATRTITDDDLQGGTSYTWSSDTTYLLDGFVFLEAGGILTIEPGTVIKGLQSPSNDDLASTLVITRGAQIFAEGTRNNPIIFTAEIDDTEDSEDMFVDDRGLWGGLILLGNATITNETDEVIVEGLPADDDRSLYGGSDDMDNSGVLKYISIRHGGAELAPGEEINGLTLGGVGSGTSLSFVEVLANVDDGIEFFGGTVDMKYATVAFCGDDAIDWDTGWRGRGQFWSVLQGADAADNGAEMDGAKPDANTPSSNPQVYNVTYVGSGQGAAAANEHALYFRDGTRGGYYNSIFTDYANYAIQVEDRASGVDSRQYMEEGELVIANNLWFGFGEGNELNAGDNGFIQATDDAEDPTAQFLIDHLAANSNAVVDPQLGGISRDADGGYDPRPAADGPAYTTAPAPFPTDDFYTKVNFKGAYCAEGSWLTGWTALAEYGVMADGVDYTDFTDEFACDLLQASVTRTIQDDDLVGGQSYTFSSDTIYLLDGFVFLEAGGTLTIEPGTVIKGLQSPSNDDLASTLVITRGAQIFAEGTRNNPIIFTAEIDDTEDPNDMFVDDRGLWGGLILLGNATITNETDEVIVEGLPADDDRSLYGGSDDADNSGVLKYISIRHGGAELAPGEEINGLTLGGVGSGTSLSFVEVLANVDDGIEFFGGTVDLKYATVAFCGDDAIDWDTGWRGRGQFWSVLQGADAADNGAEMDGAKPDANTPSSNPQVYNVTYVGSGQGAAAANEHALYFRDGTRGGYYNSIFTDYANYAIQVEDRASGVDSRQYMEEGELVIANNLWFGFGEGSELNAGDNGFIQATDDAEDPTAQFLIDHLAANSNAVVDPQLGGISRDADGGYDPRPAADGPAYTTTPAGYPTDDFYTKVNFKGAYCAEGSWLTGWTALAEYGVMSDDVDYTDFTDEFACDLLQASVTRTIQDDDLVGGQSYTFSSDTIYLLDGFVFLEAGGTLTIEPGTVIKGLQDPSNDDLASTLVITRGAQIFAEGTRNNPIIFTAEIDDTEDPNDMFVDDRGLWGGLILLGNATITNETDEVIVEGLPADDDRSLYGGSDDADNSGVLKYISIRHGGAELAPGEEINGLTLGGVGSGTSLSFVEVLANVDDGIEFFGGTVDMKYATVAFCGDDAIDWDTGWRGRGQFWSVLQGADAADNGAEMDGAKPDANTPSSNPEIYNVTYIGSGQGAAAANEHALYFRDGTRGQYHNSIFTDYANYAIQVEDRASGVDSRQYMEEGELVIANNLWFGFGEGSELNAGDNGIIQATDDAEDPTAQFLIDHLAANGNQIIDPELGGISRSADNGLDPRPAMDGPAYTTPATGYAESDFFTPVAFKGAYCANGSWLSGWTALDEYGVQASGIDYTDFTSDFGCDLSTDVETIVKSEQGVKLFQNTPNPVVDVTLITFELPTTAMVNLEVYDINGRMISRLIDGEERILGQHTIEFNATNLEDGIYLYRLTAGNVQITKPFVVNR